MAVSGVFAAMLHQADPPSAHLDRFVLEQRPPRAAWPVDASPDLVYELHDFVKRQSAPCRYPRQVDFVENLTRAETGKLRQMAETCAS